MSPDLALLLLLLLLLSNVGDVAEQVIGAAGVAVVPEYGVKFE